MQGNCSKTDCKYKHCPPASVGLGNEKTSWEDVRAREGEFGYVESRGMGMDGPGGRMMERGGMGCGDMVPFGGGGMIGGPPMMGDGGGMRAMGGMGPMGGMGGGPSHEEFLQLKRENESLRQEVMELQKKNDGLKATNQFLLEENASMRMKEGGRAGGGSVPAYTSTYSSGAGTGNSYSSSQQGSSYGSGQLGYSTGTNNTAPAGPAAWGIGPGAGGAGATRGYGGEAGYGNGSGAGQRYGGSGPAGWN